MKTDHKGEKVLPLLRATLGTLLEHKIILFPFCIIAAIQLFILEILYFFPRYPLNVIFGPLVRKLWSEQFLHYPYNFTLLPKLFQYCQMPLYILVSSFFIAVGVNILSKINEDSKFTLKSVFAQTLTAYVHVFMSALLSFCLVFLFFKAYGLVYERAMQIRSVQGPFYMIKLIAINAAPYLNMLWSVFVTTLMAYMIPIIVIKQKKFFPALVMNFKFLRGSFWKTFFIIMFPSLLFLPVMWLRNIFTIDLFAPEFAVVTLVVSIVVSVFIDALVYSALTIRYLWKAEEK